MSREIRFRAWNGRFMEHGGFYVHATGEIQKESALGDVSSGCPLMQYTGLKDKSGVEIFEGDIVLVREVRVCEVVFHEFAGCWDLKLRNVISSLSIGSISPAGYKYHTEVIGNIYSNPELLGGEK